jgi:UDP-xylose/UDP-N-acetylglucosamine transporter B4
MSNGKVATVKTRNRGRSQKADNNPIENEGPKESHTSLASIATAATYTVLPSGTTIALMISLIFGGCCANVGG